MIRTMPSRTHEILRQSLSRPRTAPRPVTNAMRKSLRKKTGIANGVTPETSAKPEPNVGELTVSSRPPPDQLMRRYLKLTTWIQIRTLRRRCLWQPARRRPARLVRTQTPPLTRRNHLKNPPRPNRQSLVPRRRAPAPTRRQQQTRRRLRPIRSGRTRRKDGTSIPRIEMTMARPPGLSRGTCKGKKGAGAPTAKAAAAVAAAKVVVAVGANREAGIKGG